MLDTLVRRQVSGDGSSVFCLDNNPYGCSDANRLSDTRCDELLEETSDKLMTRDGTGHGTCGMDASCWRIDWSTDRTLVSAAESDWLPDQNSVTEVKDVSEDSTESPLDVELALLRSPLNPESPSASASSFPPKS